MVLAQSRHSDPLVASQGLAFRRRVAQEMQLGHRLMDKEIWILTGLVWGAVFALFFYFRWRFSGKDYGA
jgi:hypothetical protein